MNSLCQFCIDSNQDCDVVRYRHIEIAAFHRVRRFGVERARAPFKQLEVATTAVRYIAISRP
jgi:hypothetical protein